VAKKAPLPQNPRDPALSLHYHRMCVVLGVCGAAPVLRGRTARMFKPATHRARERDRHAAITGPVKCRRVARERPCKRSRRNDTNDNAGDYQRGAAFARRERITRWSLASVDRRSPLHPANSIRPQYMHLPRLRIPCDHWSASRGTQQWIPSSTHRSSSTGGRPTAVRPGFGGASAETGRLVRCGRCGFSGDLCGGVPH
jgi:hypothetical protein